MYVSEEINPEMIKGVERYPTQKYTDALDGKSPPYDCIKKRSNEITTNRVSIFFLQAWCRDASSINSFNKNC